MGMQQNNAGDDWIRRDFDPGVTIFHGCTFANVERRKFQVVIYKLLKDSTDISKVGKNGGQYINAYEWMLANVYRIVGIQLYSDFDIRLNVLPEEPDNKNRCVFLTDVTIIHPELNNMLYSNLMEFVYGKVSQSVC
ncbi:MAG: hypothetical protein IKR04_03185 [Clostridia bacterium]|nr:hypothetical protein [Clostridia bacterium]